MVGGQAGGLLPGDLACCVEARQAASQPSGIASSHRTAVHHQGASGLLGPCSRTFLCHHLLVSVEARSCQSICCCCTHPLCPVPRACIHLLCPVPRACTHPPFALCPVPAPIPCALSRVPAAGRLLGDEALRAAIAERHPQTARDWAEVFAGEMEEMERLLQVGERSCSAPGLFACASHGCRRAGWPCPASASLANHQRIVYLTQNFTELFWYRRTR